MNLKAKFKSILEMIIFCTLFKLFHLVTKNSFDSFTRKVNLDDAKYYIIFEFLFFLLIALAIFTTQLPMNAIRKKFGIEDKTKLLTDIFVSSRWGSDLLLGFSIGAIFMSVTMALAYLGGAYTPDHSVNFNINFAVPLVFFLLVGMAEELIFRGFIFLTLEKGFGTRWAIIIASLLFGFFHMLNKLNGIAEDYKPLCCLFLAIEAGFLLNAAFLVRRNLWIPVGIHWSWNLFETSIFGAKEGQIDFLPSLFTGHYQPGLFLPGFPMGMESCYITLATGLITGCILMKYAKSNRARQVLQATKSRT